MNMLGIEIKRLLRNYSFVFLYLFFAVLTLFFALTIDLGGEVDYRSLIAVIDEENSDKSRNFIERINRGTAIKADFVEVSDSRDLILNKGYGAVLTIPMGFFDELPNSRLIYEYAENDAVSGALIDLIAQGFVQDSIEKVLEERIINEFGEDRVDISIEEYENLKKETKFDLEVIESVSEKAGGLKSEVDEREIAAASSFLLYVAGLGVLFASISLNISKLKNKGILGALLVRNRALTRYFVSKKLIDYTLVAFPLLVSSLIIMSSLGFRISSIIYFVLCGLLANLVIYELCEFINYVIDTEYSIYLLFFAGLSLALIGGAFFSLDLLPAAVIDISRKTPLGFLKKAFFDSYYGTLDYGMFAIFMGLLIMLVVLNYRLLRRRAV